MPTLDVAKHFLEQEVLIENRTSFIVRNIVQHQLTIYKKNGRIPFKIKMSDLYKVSRKYFGTWNKAIEVAGFTPNPVMFAKNILQRMATNAIRWQKK